MHLKTQALDCLYLNWALPLARAPELPPPLRYQVHRWRDEDWVFASALLFHLAGLHLQSLPLLRLSYPQLSFRLYVLDADGVPSVLFRRMMVPFWVVPASRLVGRRPAIGARFSFPPPPLVPRDEGWSWHVRRRRRGATSALEVAARPAAPRLGRGPELGSWERTVDYFRRRPRGYVLWDRRLRAITRSHPRVAVWPLEVEVRAAGLIEESLEGAGEELLRAPHSAWVCPEIPIVFELGEPIRLPLGALPATAESRG